MIQFGGLTPILPIPILVSAVKSNLLQRLTHITHKRKFYFRMLTAYAIFTVVMVLISSLVLSGYARAFLSSEIEISSRHLLAQVKVFMDRSVLQEVYRLINREFLNPTTSSRIAEFFMLRNHAPDFYLYVKNALSDIAINSKYIDSVYLYKLESDTLVESEGGVTFDATERTGLTSSPLNTQILAYARARVNREEWLPPSRNTGFSKDNPRLSFIKAIPLYAEVEEILGYVIVNINERALVGDIRDIYNIQNSEIITVASTGVALSHTNANGLFAPINEKVIQAIGGHSGFKVLSLDGEIVGISWIQSSAANWYYVSLSPQSALNERLFALKKMTTVILTVAIVFSVLVLIPITLRLYQPLRNLVSSAKSQIGVESDNEEEIDFISETITGLASRVDEMNSTIEENKRLIEHKMINDILFGNVRDRDAILNRIHYMGIDTYPPLFALLLVDIDQRQFADLRYDPREFVTLRSIDIIRGFFGTTSLAAAYEPGRLAAIIETESMVQTADIYSLLEIIEDGISFKSNAVWSATNFDPEKLHKAFTDMKSFENYSFLHGYGNAFSLDDLTSMEDRTLDLRAEDKTLIQSSISSGNLQEFYGFLSKFKSRAIIAGVSHSSAMSCLNQICSLVTQGFINQGVESEIVNSTASDISIISASSFDVAVSRVRKLSEFLDSSRTKRNREIDSAFINRICKYIHKTVNRETSLVTVSDEFGISAGHLSRIFKEGTGKSFSNYVFTERMERAAKLLKTQLHTPVAEIGHEVGYDNASYFSRLFRERYGVTPAKYRKSKIQSTA